MEIILHGEVDGVSETRRAAGGGDCGFEVVGLGAGDVAILRGAWTFAYHGKGLLGWLLKGIGTVGTIRS